MPTPRVCQISDDTFGGFEVVIDLDYFYTLDEISAFIKTTLINSLKRVHLEVLVNTAKNKKLHIHDKNFCQLRNMNADDILYVCGHC